MSYHVNPRHLHDYVLVDPCKPNPCKNGATCQNGNCICTSICSGKKCEICVGRFNIFS